MSQRTEELIADSPPTPDIAVPRALSVPWPATWIMLLSLSAVLNALLVIGNHGARGFFVPVLAMGICLLAALFDACTANIPNPLTYTTILLGLGLNALALLSAPHSTLSLWLAVPGFRQSLIGFAICATIAILGLFVDVGGGDLKLLIALGALLGLANVCSVLIVALTIAALYALLNLAVRGRLNLLVQLVALKTVELFYLRRFDLPPTDTATTEPGKLNFRNSVPMAVPLALGLLLTQLLDLQSKWGITP